MVRSDLKKTPQEILDYWSNLIFKKNHIPAKPLVLSFSSILLNSHLSKNLIDLDYFISTILAIFYKKE